MKKEIKEGAILFIILISIYILGLITGSKKIFYIYGFAILGLYIFGFYLAIKEKEN